MSNFKSLYADKRPEDAKDAYDALNDLGFRQVSATTKAGVLQEETLFNQEGVCIVLKYTYIKG